MNLFKIKLEPKDRILLYFFLMIFLGFLLYCLTLVKNYGGNNACFMLVYVMVMIVMSLLLISFCVEVHQRWIELKAKIGLGKSFSVNSCTKSRFFHLPIG